MSNILTWNHGFNSKGIQIMGLSFQYCLTFLQTFTIFSCHTHQKVHLCEESYSLSLPLGLHRASTAPISSTQWCRRSPRKLRRMSYRWLSRRSRTSLELSTVCPGMEYQVWGIGYRMLKNGNGGGMLIQDPPPKWEHLLLLIRRDCEVMEGELQKAGIAALCYHAGLSDGERSSVQQRWVQEDHCKVSSIAHSIMDIYVC